MTLHPWPLNDHGDLHEIQQVLWTGLLTNASQLGLLTDSLAVPLRFASELPVAAPVAAMATKSEPRDDKTAFLRIRDMSARFGSAC